MTNTAVGSCTIKQKLFQEVAIISDRFFLISNGIMCKPTAPDFDFISYVTDMHNTRICIEYHTTKNDYFQSMHQDALHKQYAFEYL